MPIQIAALNQGRLRLRSLQHQHPLRLMFGQRQGAINQRLVFDHPIEFQPARGRQQQLGAGIVDPQRQLVGGKTAEHHRMHCTDTGAGEHGHGRLGHHGHVDDHPVTLLHAKFAQQSGQARHFVAQLHIGELLLAAGHWRVINQRGLLTTPLFDLMVQGQVAAVEATVGKPLMGAIGVFTEGLQWLAVPGQVIGLIGPERSRIGDGMGVTVLISHRY
ncbi:hypothetical protein D3C77_227130 [compost metagenome]